MELMSVMLLPGLYPLQLCDTINRDLRYNRYLVKPLSRCDVILGPSDEKLHEFSKWKPTENYVWLKIIGVQSNFWKTICMFSAVVSFLNCVTNFIPWVVFRDLVGCSFKICYSEEYLQLSGRRVRGISENSLLVDEMGNQSHLHKVTESLKMNFKLFFLPRNNEESALQPMFDAL